jgi:hypothetical protein
LSNDENSELGSRAFQNKKIAPIMITKQCALVKVEYYYNVNQTCHQHAYLAIEEQTTTKWAHAKNSSKNPTQVGSNGQGLVTAWARPEQG